MLKHIGLLGVLFVVLLGAVIVKETSRPDASSLRDQLPQQALGPKPWKTDDAARIVVQGPGTSDAFTLKKGDGVWTVEDPFRAPAAAGVVDTFLTAVNAARGELRLDDAAALAKFDLNDDRATRVTIEDAAGLTLVHFALGKSSGKQGAFVRPLFDGVRDGAYAVSQDLRGGLGLTQTQPGDSNVQSPQPAHFHDLALPPISVGDPMRVELATPNWSVAFEKRGPAWVGAEGAPSVPLRGQGIDQLVRQYAGSNAATALIDPATLGETGLDAPAYTVRVAPIEGTPRVAFGSVVDKKCFVRLESDAEPQVVYELTRYAFDRLFPKGSTLFEFAPLDADQLTRLDVKRNGQGFSLVREGPSDDWVIESPAWPLAPAATQLRSVGSMLRSIRAVDWYAGSASFDEEITVSYGTKETAADALTVLRIGQAAPGGDGRLAKLPGSEDVVVLATSAVERLAPERLSLFEPRPLGSATVDDLTSVVVREIAPADGSKTELFELVSGEDGWAVAQGGAAQPGVDIQIELFIDHLLDVEVTTRSDYVGPFAREIEIRREGEAPVVIAFGDVSESLGTAVRIGDVTFFANVDEAVGSVDPGTLVRPAEPRPPEQQDADQESPDEEDAE